MAKIARGTEKVAVKETRLQINAQAVVIGSKEMTAEQQEEACTHDFLTVTLTAPDGTVVFTGKAAAKEFSSGSVGYFLTGKGAF